MADKTIKERRALALLAAGATGGVRDPRWLDEQARHLRFIDTRCARVAAALREIKEVGDDVIGDVSEMGLTAGSIADDLEEAAMRLRCDER